MLFFFYVPIFCIFYTRIRTSVSKAALMNFESTVSENCVAPGTHELIKFFANRKVKKHNRNNMLTRKVAVLISTYTLVLSELLDINWLP